MEKVDEKLLKEEDKKNQQDYRIEKYEKIIGKLVIENMDLKSEYKFKCYWYEKLKQSYNKQSKMLEDIIDRK